MPHNLFNTYQTFDAGFGTKGRLYSLPQLEKEGVGAISRLPVSIRIILESVLRNYDQTRISEKDVRNLSRWEPRGERTEEIPFMVARVLLQDFTGVPLLVDLAAMRSAAERFGKNPKIIEPLVPVDLVIDHSVQVDFSGTADALDRNMEIEFLAGRLDLSTARRVVSDLESVLDKMERNVNSRLLAEVLLLDLPKV